MICSCQPCRTLSYRVDHLQEIFMTKYQSRDLAVPLCSELKWHQPVTEHKFLSSFLHRWDAYCRNGLWMYFPTAAVCKRTCEGKFTFYFHTTWMLTEAEKEKLTTQRNVGPDGNKNGVIKSSGWKATNQTWNFQPLFHIKWSFCSPTGQNFAEYQQWCRL